jgi:hypothetical protein
LENLILLCGFHHRFVHEHGWKIEADPEGRPFFMKPNGEAFPPQRPAVEPRILELAGRST